MMTDNLKTVGVFKDHKDGSIKSVYEASTNEFIEVTLLFNKYDRDVVCVPTHYFCNLGCKMCHLTKDGLKKGMKPIPSVNLIEAIVKSVCYRRDSNNTDPYNTNHLQRRTHKRKLLISFMGVGEPLLNISLLEDLVSSKEELANCLGYDVIGFSIATMMPNDNIKLIKNLVQNYNTPIKIHFSLHTPFDNERFDLLPSTNVTVDKAFEMLADYMTLYSIKTSNLVEEYSKLHNSNIPVEIHYTLIQQVNDSDTHLKRIIELLGRYMTPIKFITFNPTQELKASLNVDNWMNKIAESIPQLVVKRYTPPGKEIGSSCGEFTKHYYHKEIETKEQLNEFKKWEHHHKIYENYRRDYINWNDYYMGIAVLSSKRSKDPSTQVGACIVGEDKRILSIGYNGTPNMIDDDYFNWAKDGELINTKYAYVIHAEMNAILNYKGNINNLRNSTLYVTLFPCNECAKFIVQSGISKIVYLSDKYAETESTKISKILFDECNVSYEQYNGSTLPRIFKESEG